MSNSFDLITNPGAFRESEERAIFLAEYDKAVANHFRKMEAEEIKAYNKYRNFVINS